MKRHGGRELLLACRARRMAVAETIATGLLVPYHSPDLIASNEFQFISPIGIGSVQLLVLAHFLSSVINGLSACSIILCTPAVEPASPGFSLGTVTPAIVKAGSLAADSTCVDSPEASDACTPSVACQAFLLVTLRFMLVPYSTDVSDGERLHRFRCVAEAILGRSLVTAFTLLSRCP